VLVGTDGECVRVVEFADGESVTVDVVFSDGSVDTVGTTVGKAGLVVGLGVNEVVGAVVLNVG
jgi:hypothetical protein